MPIKFLVVTDSAADRLLIKNALSEYSILTAGDGGEAMRLLEEDEGINLLLLDLNTPKINGVQVLESLKKNARFRKLCTIILTDHDALENESKGLKLGAVDYIRKPIQIDSLKARINLHLALLRAQQRLERQQDSYNCLAPDITERKAMEKALRESERSKSVFLSHLPGLAYRCNYDRNWTMQYVSQGCFNLTGYPPESLLYNRDITYNDLIAPEYREALWNEWRRILTAREPFKYEYEIITAAGERKWVLEMGEGIYNEAGAVEALEGLILDISERKAVENTLKYNNEHDRWTGLYNRDYLVSLLEKDIKLNKYAKKALIGINLSMVHMIAVDYGYQYAQNIINRAADVLSQHCTERCLLFYPRENRFIFYLFDYEDREELVAFSNLIIAALNTVFVTDRIGGGIGILEIEQEQDVEMLLRRLLIA